MLDIENRNFRYYYLKEIRKDKARRLFYDGISIYILPKKLNHLSYYNELKEIKCSDNVDFDDLIEFERKDTFLNRDGTLKFYYINLEDMKPLFDTKTLFSF